MKKFIAMALCFSLIIILVGCGKGKIANAFSKNERYEEAISYWQKAFDCMEKPRYTDFYEAITHCYIFLGRKKDVAKTYKKELELLKDEWNVAYGGEVERIKEAMNDLPN